MKALNYLLSNFPFKCKQHIRLSRSRRGHNNPDLHSNLSKINRINATGLDCLVVKVTVTLRNGHVHVTAVPQPPAECHFALKLITAHLEGWTENKMMKI